MGCRNIRESDGVGVIDIFKNRFILIIGSVPSSTNHKEKSVAQYSNLLLVRQGQVWHVVTKSDHEVVAEICLDEYRALYAVVFCSGIGSADRTAVLQLAVNYVQHFLNAEYGSCDLSHPYSVPAYSECSGSPLSGGESDALMNFGQIPEGFCGEDHYLLSALQNGRVQIFDDVNVTAEEAIHQAITRLENSGVTYKFCAVPSWVTPDDDLFCEVCVEGSRAFTFWKELFHVPESGCEESGQYIIPMYHPMMQGKNNQFLIQGDLSFMWSTATPIRWVTSPPEVRVVLSDGSTCDGRESWQHLKHPFKAEGKQFRFSVDRLKVRTESGQRELTAFIEAALGVNGKYLSVIGGFRPPFCDPITRLHELKHSSCVELGRKRSTAGHCVWSYYTLATEQRLNEAFIPPWFIREGWLSIYDGAEVRHGID